MQDARSIPVFSPTAVNTPDYDIFDLMGSWTFEEPGVTVRLGVNNLTDEDPPFYTSYSNSNTDPGAFDVLGRRWFAGVGVKF
jgi:outer membrane receptor protein involved in Fe transport